MENVGGVKKGYTVLENYKNIIIISADRNGSTAFQKSIFKIPQNQDAHHVWLGECFSNDKGKGLPNNWYDESIKPKDVVEHFNKGVGKGVYLKIQITWPNFNYDYFDIPAERRIFLHRNLFDSTLSRCVAQLTGEWFTFKNSTIPSNKIIIDLDFFKSRLEYRLERYVKYIKTINQWRNEYYRYETHNFDNMLDLQKNQNRKQVVDNYDELFDLYKQYNEIEEIEKCLN